MYCTIAFVNEVVPKLLFFICLQNNCFFCLVFYMSSAKLFVICLQNSSSYWLHLQQYQFRWEAASKLSAPAHRLFKRQLSIFTRDRLLIFEEYCFYAQKNIVTENFRTNYEKGKTVPILTINYLTLRLNYLCYHNNMLKLFSTKDFQQKSLSLEMFNSILERASEEKNKHRLYSLK